jgi:plasmid stability protein
MTLILQLPDSKEAALKARAQAQGVSAEQCAQQVLDRDLERPESPATGPAPRRISHRIAEVIGGCAA